MIKLLKYFHDNLSIVAILAHGHELFSANRAKFTLKLTESN